MNRGTIEIAGSSEITDIDIASKRNLDPLTGEPKPSQEELDAFFGAVDSPERVAARAELDR